MLIFLHLLHTAFNSPPTPPALLIWFSFFDKTLQGISWESKLANIAGLLVSSSPISKSKIYRRKGGIYLDCADCWEGRISDQWQRCARGVQLTRPGRFHTNLTICDDWQPGRSVNMVERFWSNDGHTIRREGRLLLVSLVGRNKKLFKSFLSYIWQQMEANDKQKQLFTHYVNSQVREGLFGQMFPKSWYCQNWFMLCYTFHCC